MNRERTPAKTANDAKDRFILRFHDVGQRESIKSRAAKNKRTMNAEILFLLDVGVEAADGVKNSAP